MPKSFTMDLPLRWNGSWPLAILDEYAASAFSLGARENVCQASLALINREGLERRPTGLGG